MNPAKPMARLTDDPHAAFAQYRDRKRWWWLLSVVFPLLPFAGMAAHAASGSQIALGLPLLISYGLMPLLDYLIGEDESNPPEAIVPQLEEDRYYRWLTWATVPLHYVALIGCAWWVGTHSLSWWAVLLFAYVAGTDSGLGLNTGHELGHKNTALEKALAKIVLAPSGYGHFYVEHNRGHHRDVATPADPASSRMGESIYAFVLREMPGAWFRAWALERTRLQQAGLPVVSWHNHIVQPAVLTLALWSGLALWLGWMVLPFLVAASFWANFQLTSANYIEHYGLLRQQRADGRFEPCQPHHSWNSNHIFSNWIVFHLQRHSDHHAHPLRRYQSLRHFDELPTLPSGYFGMFLVAYVPPLWRAVMDPRLLKAVGRDLRRLNLDPRQRAALIAHHGLQAAA